MLSAPKSLFKRREGNSGAWVQLPLQEGYPKALAHFLFWGDVFTRQAGYPGARVTLGLGLHKMYHHGQVYIKESTAYVTWIAVRKKRTNWEKNFRDGECWTPVVFQNVQTYHTL